LICGLSGLVGLLPGGPRRFLALVAGLALQPRFDEAALLGRSQCGRKT